MVALADPDIASSSLAALEKIDPDWRNSPLTQRAIPHLLGRLNEPDKLKRERAANTCRLIGPPAVQAVPVFLRRLADYTHVRTEVVQALDRIDPTWRESAALRKAIQKFVSHLEVYRAEDASGLSTEGAVLGLRLIGPSSSEAVTDLVVLLLNSQISHSIVQGTLETIGSN